MGATLSKDVAQTEYTLEELNEQLDHWTDVMEKLSNMIDDLLQESFELAVTDRVYTKEWFVLDRKLKAISQQHRASIKIVREVYIKTDYLYRKEESSYNSYLQTSNENVVF